MRKSSPLLLCLLSLAIFSALCFRNRVKTTYVKAGKLFDSQERDVSL